ncbi:MAG: EAL domain-containing protein [Marinobacter sp.]|nr:EAL domain-containing protein [Marinobacter sp.]
MTTKQHFTGFSQSIYELIAQRAPLDVLLSAITSVMENELPDALISVMLYSQETDVLNLVAGSSFSESYRAAMQDIPVSPRSGACGSAAYFHELVICDDLATDERWRGFHDIVAREGLAACWSTPLIDTAGNLLGTFATYYREKRQPTDEEIKLMRRAASLVVLAITHQQEVSLRETTEEQLRLLERGIQSSSNGMVMVDALDPVMPLVFVNEAFLEITGYIREELIGRNCRLLQGENTDPMAVEALRRSLKDRRRAEVTLLNYRKNGDAFWNHLVIEPVFNDSGQCTHFVGTQHDVTRQHENEQLLHHHATHDLLTGLPNRTLFAADLARACQESVRSDKQVTVLHVDLDDFKPVNSSLGYSVGDLLLVAVGKRLEETVGEFGVVARLGGDEFAVLLEGVSDEQEITNCAGKILADLSRPLDISGHRLHISASIGIASQHARPMRAEELICYADAAVQDAKAQGRNTWHWFEGSVTAVNNEYVALRRELMEAIEQEQFLLYYQPIVAADSGIIRGMEALVRWHHPERGLISPGEFIPLAEQTGQIVAIGHWVLLKACADLAAWNHKKNRRLPVSVNISPLQFRRYGFLAEVRKALEVTGLDPELLELEVTENVLMSGAGQAIETLQEIRKLGVKVSIDDFGTGYSSLRYLRQLPINKVKLDRSFIMDITENPDNAAIVQGVITMAHHLGLVVVGEGVETREQAADLKQRDCDLLQGYLFSRPVPLDQLECKGLEKN